MKSMVIFLVALSAAMGQTGTGAISGTVVDAETQKPVPGALVMAVSGGPPRTSKNTKSGGDGAFQIGGLAAGTLTELRRWVGTIRTLRSRDIRENGSLGCREISR